MVYVSDTSDFLNASIEKVIKTLFEAFLLVFLVVFLFLQNYRSTLIPAVAVPVAIVGTFFLTLSPALSALVLKPHLNETTKQNIFTRFASGFNKYFAALTTLYVKVLRLLGKKQHYWITVLIIFLFAGVMLFLMNTTPTGFIPPEDSGEVLCMVSLPPSSSLERTELIIQDVVTIASSIPEVKYVMNLAGMNFMSGIGSPYGTLMIKLVPWKERTRTASDIVSEMTQRTSSIIEAEIMIFAAPTLRGFGLSSGVEFQMQDKTGGDIYDFYAVTQDFLSKLQGRNEILRAFTNFNPNFPQKQIDVNMARVKEAGLVLDDILSTLQMYIGSLYTSNFTLYGKSYRVILQADPEFRRNMESLNSIYVKTASGEMAPITEFFTVTEISDSPTYTRFNMYTSMDVTVIPDFSKGYGTGNVIEIVNEMGTENLPVGYGYEFTGATREEVKSGSQTMIIFLLCLIFVYLLLCALYDSYLLPLSVILSLPVGLAGVFIFLSLFGVPQGISNNIYVQISLIMLIGLLGKNAILIVEYAIQRREQGLSIVESAIQGATARLRPILMTSFAFIAGIMPLFFATGAGSIGNRSIGISANGGMFIGTVLGVLVIPSLYIIFQSLQDLLSKKNADNHNKGTYPLAMIIIVFGFSSCAVTNRYQTPDVETSNLYRDYYSDDTTTIPHIPWKDFFIDNDLITLIEEGLDKNADLQMAVVNIRQAETNLSMARAAYFPAVALAGQVTNISTSDANKAFAYNANNFSLGIAASWELDLWGKMTSQKRSQYALFLKSHAYKNLIQSSLIANIATSYYALLALDERLRITTETVQLLEENVATMEALKEAGMQNAAAVEQSRALMLNTKLSIYELESNIRQMENAICVLLERGPGAIKRATLNTQTVPGHLQTGIPAQILSKRPDVRQAELDFRSAFELTNVAQANFYPSIGLNSGSMIGFVSPTFSSFFSTENLIANVIGGLTQPIFNRRQLAGNLKIAKARQEIALITFQNTVIRAGQEVSDILFAYQSSVNKNPVRQAQIEATQKAVEYTQALLKAGVANYTEVLNAEQNYLSAQLNRVSDKLEQLQYVVNLYKALGRGGE